jgi:uncharacterized protein (TIGR02598 family)
MNRALARSGFSLVEVTLALGVAGFCLIAIMGLLPIGIQTNRTAVQQTTANGILSGIVSDIRTVPKVSNDPGNSSKQYKLVFPTSIGGQRFLYFSNEGSTGQRASQASSDTTFYATITSLPPPAGAGSRAPTLLHVRVAWPYNGNTSSTPAGFVETFLTLDRN